MNSKLAVSPVAEEPGLRLIAYLYYPTDHDPVRQVWRMLDLDSARAHLRRTFADDYRAHHAELWQEDVLIARLRRPDKPATA